MRQRGAEQWAAVDLSAEALAEPLVLASISREASSRAGGRGSAGLALGLQEKEAARKAVAKEVVKAESG